MNISNLDKVNTLWKDHKYWKEVLAAYQANNVSLSMDLKYSGGHTYSLNTIPELDRTKDGPIAALVCQALTKRLVEIEQALKALGVEVDRPMEPSGIF